MSNGRYGPPQGAVVEGEGTPAPEYPRCELKILYDCNLCKKTHTTSVAARSSGAAPGFWQKMMKQAKNDFLRFFFTEHPKAKSKDLDVSKLKAEEIKYWEPSEAPEVDKIAVSLLFDEIKAFRAALVEVKEEVPEKEEEEEKDIAIEEAEEKGPIETGTKEGMSFSELEEKINKELEKLTKEFESLTERLEKVKVEMAKFKKMSEAIKEAKKVEKMKGLNQE